ncbi:MAG: hypothetical protein EZS28_007105 [Streblomastix strix]|uniref:Uncharacterized protein n=1 Tax=Streblomastix strix TaxID=222440 RepID=A0A5J4WS63_9EUKA|nr:MAG: hypothetical protein EZS28_007105 [Streblomastix strix]
MSSDSKSISSKKSPQNFIQLDDFDILGKSGRLSPHTMQAIRQEGILIDELKYKAKESFQDQGVPDDHAQLMYDHYEKNRKALIVKLKQVREDIIEEEANQNNDQEIDAGVDPRIEQERKRLLKVKEKREAEIQ